MQTHRLHPRISNACIRQATIRERFGQPGSHGCRQRDRDLSLIFKTFELDTRMGTIRQIWPTRVTVRDNQGHTDAARVGWAVLAPDCQSPAESVCLFCNADEHFFNNQTQTANSNILLALTGALYVAMCQFWFAIGNSCKKQINTRNMLTMQKTHTHVPRRSR